MTNQSDNRSFRLVCESGLRESVKSLLMEEGFRFQEEPFSPICQKFTKTPFAPGSSLAAFFGYIYIQDRSSMLPPLALNPALGSRILDMCASPGSKTGFLAQITGDSGFVLANEPNNARYATLRANLQRLNIFNAGLCRYNGAFIPFSENTLDNILLDPPCSGWGTVAKHPSVTQIWKKDRLNPLIRIQKSLLDHAMKLLAPGGRLLYSTCTTNKEENEVQIEKALTDNGLHLIPLEPFSGFHFDQELLRKGMLLVDAESSQSQGFFLALLEKDIPDGKKSMPPPKENYREEKKHGQIAAAPIPLPGTGEARIFENSVRFISDTAKSFVPRHLSWEAPLLGKVSAKGDFKPLPRLRYKQYLENLPQVKLNDIQKIRALINGQTVNSSHQNGLVALYWDNLPLGCAHIKNGRLINNFH